MTLQTLLAMTKTQVMIALSLLRKALTEVALGQKYGRSIQIKASSLISSLSSGTFFLRMIFWRWKFAVARRAPTRTSKKTIMSLVLGVGAMGD